MPVLKDTTQLYPVNKFGLGGLNSFDEAASIEDIELADIKNMVFDDGILKNRQGSLLNLAKPTGETSNPFQMLVATNSNGVDFLIANYGVNFYLQDTTNSQWIKLNTGFTPATSGVFYGSTNWNNGTNDDRFYFGNGVDDTMKWVMAVNTVKTTTAAGDAFIELNSTTSFPASGTAIVVNAGTAFNVTYTSVGRIYTATTIAFTNSNTITDSANGFITAGFIIGDVINVTGSVNNNNSFTVTNVVAGTLTVTEATVTEAAGPSVTLTAQKITRLNITGTVGQIVPAGSTVTVPIVDATAVPKGSVFTKSLGRLFVANAEGAENTLHYSISSNPESYSVSSDINSGGFYTLYKGKGGILGMTDYGQYLIIEKIDVISQFTFNVASDNSGFIVEVFPLISGDGIGPASDSEILNYMNILYYPTVGEGIVSFSPAQTGTSTGSNLNLLSQKINNLVTEQYDFSLSRTCGLAQKLYWLVALPTVGVLTTVNNLVLMYDLVRASQNPTLSAWTTFDNWDAVDLKPVNGILYYLSADDGALYEAYEGYQDAEDGNAVPYTSAFLSKRFNLNSPATLMKGQYIYIEGIISLNTTFYLQTLYNESGALGSQSYKISGTDSTITSNTFTAGMGRFIMGSPLLGGVDLETIKNESSPLFFRAYLEISQAYREHNIQLLGYSIALGSQWGISKMVLITQPEQSIETALVISPSSIPAISS